MEVLLNKVCGRPAHETIELRRCTPEQAPLLFALQNEVHAGMLHKEQFVTDDLASIEKDIREGIAVGAWQGDRLGGYVVIHFCGQDPHNYAAFLGVPQSEWDHWANGNSAVVHPDWRGNGLQQKMVLYAMSFLPERITHIGATVSPDNAYSLNNALALGFEIKARREMYGGYDRYILAKEL